MNSMPPESAADIARQAEIDAYKKALRDFDWDYEFSNMGPYVRKCSEALRQLKKKQAELDPDKTIWNSRGR